MLSSLSLTNDLDELGLADVEISWDTIVAVAVVVVVVVFVAVRVVLVVLISIYDNNYIISFLLTNHNVYNVESLAKEVNYDVIQMFLLSTLNILYIFFLCLYCSL